MTKQEIKDLITAKIAGQGNQVDIGGALATILESVVDAMPDAPTVIDLSEWELSPNDPFDCTQYVPNDYLPKYGDSVIINGIEYYYSGSIKTNDGSIRARFGCNYNASFDTEQCAELEYFTDNPKWEIQYSEV